MRLVDSGTYTSRDPKRVQSRGKLGPHLDLCNGSCRVPRGKTEMTLEIFINLQKFMTEQNYTVKTLLLPIRQIFGQGLLKDKLMIDA